MRWGEIKRRAGAAASRLAPAAKVVERVASVAMQLQRPTPVGIIAMVSSGLAALDGDSAGAGARLRSRSVKLLADRATFLRALADAGIRTRRHGDEDRYLHFHVGESPLSLSANNYLFHDDDVALSWIRQLVDRSQDPVVEIKTKHGNGSQDDNVETSPALLRQIDSRRGDEIAKAILPFLRDGGSRVVLLTGGPGVGKTTIAHQVARRAGLGRVALLDAKVISGTGRDPGCLFHGEILESLPLASISTVIVDDIDKVEIGLESLEALRAAKLVILTANNGAYDDVLDAAMIRPGRIDDVFEVAAEDRPRAEPFGQLTDEEWARVKGWPVAWQNEVALRIRHRRDDLGLDELEQRLGRRTRSACGMKGEEKP